MSFFLGIGPAFLFLLAIEENDFGSLASAILRLVHSTDGVVAG